jgi:hypothetical protein
MAQNIAQLFGVPCKAWLIKHKGYVLKATTQQARQTANNVR